MLNAITSQIAGLVHHDRQCPREHLTSSLKTVTKLGAAYRGPKRFHSLCETANFRISQIVGLVHLDRLCSLPQNCRMHPSFSIKMPTKLGAACHGRGGS